MDCMMPVMDGYDATIQIRDYIKKQKAELKESIWKEGGEISIIALSANSLESDIDRCYKVGFNKFLSTPSKLLDLY